MEQKVAIIIYSKCVTINSKLKFVKYMYVKENILAWRGYWINSLYKVRSTFLFPWLAHLFLPHQAVGQSGPFPKGLDPLDYLSGSVFLDPLIINKKRGIKSNQILLWLYCTIGLSNILLIGQMFVVGIFARSFYLDMCSLHICGNRQHIFVPPLELNSFSCKIAGNSPYL